MDHALRTTSWVHPRGIGKGGERLRGGEKGPRYQSVLGSERGLEGRKRGRVEGGENNNGYGDVMEI